MCGDTVWMVRESEPRERPVNQEVNDLPRLVECWGQEELLVGNQAKGQRKRAWLGESVPEACEPVRA